MIIYNPFKLHIVRSALGYYHLRKLKIWGWLYYDQLGCERSYTIDLTSLSVAREAKQLVKQRDEHTKELLKQAKKRQQVRFVE